MSHTAGIICGGRQPSQRNARSGTCERLRPPRRPARTSEPVITHETRRRLYRLHRRRKRIILQGEVPNPIDLPSGCRFHPRCPVTIPACKEVDSSYVQVGPGHQAACLLLGEKS